MEIVIPEWTMYPAIALVVLIVVRWATKGPKFYIHEPTVVDIPPEEIEAPKDVETEPPRDKPLEQLPEEWLDRTVGEHLENLRPRRKDEI